MSYKKLGWVIPDSLLARCLSLTPFFLAITVTVCMAILNELNGFTCIKDRSHPACLCFWPFFYAATNPSGECFVSKMPRVKKELQARLTALGKGPQGPFFLEAGFIVEI